MESLIPFFIVLVSAFLLPEVFYRFHIPWVAALIIGGILIGPFGLDLIATEGMLRTLADIGVIFLMFHVGLETKFRLRGHEKAEVSWTLFLNGLIPFLFVFGYMKLWGIGILESIMLGLIGIASSVAIISPILEEAGLVGKKTGKILLPAAIVMDVFSLVAVTFMIEQFISGEFSSGLLVSYVVLIPLVLVLKVVFVHTSIETFWQGFIEEKQYENELKVVVAFLIGMVLLFELLGVDLLLAGFFAGFLLSDTLRNPGMERKLHTVSYGIFIPIYFLYVGASIEFPEFGLYELLFVGGVVFVVMASKYVTGFLAGRKAGLTARNSQIFGLITIPQLTTTVALTQLGVRGGIFSIEVAAAMYALVLITSIIVPILVEFRTSH
jgi:Kef-type K+ transport system membrane component KefB